MGSRLALAVTVTYEANILRGIARSPTREEQSQDSARACPVILIMADTGVGRGSSVPSYYKPRAAPSRLRVQRSR
jgi:hypothetical protein